MTKQQQLENRFAAFFGSILVGIRDNLVLETALAEQKYVQETRAEISYVRENSGRLHFR